MSRGRAISLLASAGLLAGASQVFAADPRVRTLQDTTPAPTAITAQAELMTMRDAGVCRGVRGSGSPGVSAAIRVAERALKKNVGKTAFRRVRRIAGKGRRSESLGIHAVAGGAPAAALAGELVAYADEPRNPRHLVNASVLLTRLGKPAEALALLDAADDMRFPKHPPMGIDLRALLLNNRGYALIALRRYRDAERPLRAAIEREPLLSEAQRNVAMARLCAGNASSAGSVGSAVKPYIASKRRNAGRPGSNGSPVGDVPTSDGASTLPPANKVLDLSQGVPMQLPMLRLPSTPEDAAASGPLMRAAKDEAHGRSQTDLDASHRASQQVFTNDPYRTARIAQLWALVTHWQTQRPDLKALEDGLLAGHLALRDIFGDFHDEYRQISESCSNQPTTEARDQCTRSQCQPALVSAHNNWLRAEKDQYALARTYAADLYEYTTGVAANLADPAANDSIVLAIRSLIWGSYESYVLGPAEAWTESLVPGAQRDCMGSGGAAAGEDDEGDAPAALRCPPALKAVKFSINIPLPDTPFKLGLSADCESVGVELSGITPITPFGSVDFNFVQGKTTLFAGVKGGASDTLVKGGFKNGFYVTIDGNDNITDYGVRAQLTGGTNTGGPIDYGNRAKVEYSLAGMW